MLVLMGCGDYASSQSDTDNTDSSEAVLESVIESDTESSIDSDSESSVESNSDDSFESSTVDEESSDSSEEESSLTSEVIDDDNTSELNSEVEIDFSEFE